MTISVLFVLIFGDAWYCVSFKFDLNEIALPFAIMISATQMMITYIAIGIKYQQLKETIACLNNTIERRKAVIFRKSYFHSLRCIDNN